MVRSSSPNVPMPVLAAARGGFVEFTPTEPGTYVYVTHKFNDATRGAVGLFQVG